GQDRVPVEGEAERGIEIEVKLRSRVELGPAQLLPELADALLEADPPERGPEAERVPGLSRLELDARAVVLDEAADAPGEIGIVEGLVQEQLDGVAAAVSEHPQRDVLAELDLGDGLIVEVHGRGEHRVGVFGHEVLEKEVDVAAPNGRGEPGVLTDRGLHVRGAVDEIQIDDGTQPL